MLKYLTIRAFTSKSYHLIMNYSFCHCHRKGKNQLTNRDLADLIIGRDFKSKSNI